MTLNTTHPDFHRALHIDHIRHMVQRHEGRMNPGPYAASPLGGATVASLLVPVTAGHPLEKYWPIDTVVAIYGLSLLPCRPTVAEWKNQAARDRRRGLQVEGQAPNLLYSRSIGAEKASKRALEGFAALCEGVGTSKKFLNSPSPAAGFYPVSGWEEYAPTFDGWGAWRIGGVSDWSLRFREDLGAYTTLMDEKRRKKLSGDLLHHARSGLAPRWPMLEGVINAIGRAQADLSVR